MVGSLRGVWYQCSCEGGRRTKVMEWPFHFEGGITLLGGPTGYDQEKRIRNWVAQQVKTKKGASGTRINLKLGGPTGYDLRAVAGKSDKQNTEFRPGWQCRQATRHCLMLRPPSRVSNSDCLISLID